VIVSFVRELASPNARDLGGAVHERGSERGPLIFFPDGHLLAYVTDTAGRADLLLTRYPSGEGRWQVVANAGRATLTTDDGLQWARDTNELFFFSSGRDPDGGRVTAVTIHSDGAALRLVSRFPSSRWRRTRWRAGSAYHLTGR
jgi:hypothetical protein